MTAPRPAGDADLAATLGPQVREWLEANWNPDLRVRDWWELVAQAGWSKPQFPVEHGGRDLPTKAETVVRATFKLHGALPPPGGLGHMMAAPTIITEGTPEQVARHIPPILRGQVGWCQLFSEPGAGSDLASLTTRAVRDGDNYVVTGQKVWTSQAMEADFGMLLARTDPDVPKHKGITWLVLPMNQPGVDVRPLREMTGRAWFNEVFIDEAVASADDVVGGVGGGWRVAQTTFLFERSGIGPDGTYSMLPHPGHKTGNLERRAGDLIGEEPPAFAKLEVEDLIALARSYGRDRDPVIRQEIARLVSLRRTSVWNDRRIRANPDARTASGMASVGKLLSGAYSRGSVRVANEIVGAAGMLQGHDGPLDGVVAEATVASGGAGIGGGTDQIMRNVISERVLALPREPRNDAQIPFRDLPKNTISARRPQSGAL